MRHRVLSSLGLFRWCHRPSAWLAVSLLALSSSVAAIRDRVGARATAFPRDAVRLLDGPFKQAQELEEKFLLEIDADRRLVSFREVAKLPVMKKRYGGWASCDLNGHSLGHSLSACSLMYLPGQTLRPTASL